MVVAYLRGGDKASERKKSLKDINNAKTNDRKFLTSGTIAICCFFVPKRGKCLCRLYVMFKVSNDREVMLEKHHEGKAYFLC